MKISSSKFPNATVLVMAATLAACGASEPSESDMFDAMIAYDENQAFFGKPEKFRADAKKLGCEKVGEKTYKCLVGQRDGKGGSMPFSFMKADGKWVMTAPGMSGG